MPTVKLWSIAVKDCFLTVQYSNGKPFTDKQGKPLGAIQSIQFVNKDGEQKNDSIKVRHILERIREYD